MNFHCCLAFFCMLFFCKNATAQQQDSLLQKSYIVLKKQYKDLAYTNPKLAKIYAEAALKKAEKENNELEKHLAFLLKASSENYFGNMNVSLQYIDSCIAYARRQKNDSLLTKAFSEKGRTYFTLGKFNDATTYYLKVDSVAQKTGNIRYQIYSNYSIGSIKNTIGDHKGAAELYLKNKKIFTPNAVKEKYPSQYLNMLIGLISAYTYFDEEKAAEYLPELKAFIVKHNDTDALSYYYILQAIVEYQKKEYDSALATLQQADSLITLLGTKRNLYDVYRFRGKSYYEKQQFRDAIIAFEAFKALQKEIEFNGFEYREVLSLLADSYEQMDSIKKALENYRLAHDLSYTDTIQQAIRDTIFKKYDQKSLEDKISSLQAKTTKKQRQNTSLWFISVGLLVMLIILFLVYKKREQNNKKKFDELLEKLSKDKTEAVGSEANQKYQISDEKIKKILEGLKKFEASNAFLKQNTSLVSVAKKLNTNTTYLSQIVNEQKGITFKNYITELRINYVLHKLKSDHVLRSYSIKAIAKELGFKSEGAFSRAFKKHTGIYPSFFIKNLTAIS